MLQIRIDGPLIRGLFAWGSRRGPLPEIIKTPGPHKVRIGFLRIGCYPCFGHVAVGDRAPGCGPFVRITAIDTAERIAGVNRLDAQRRVGARLCAGERLGLDLVDGTVRGLRRNGLAEEAREYGE